jgi:UDP-glucuronate 4-epimerase
MERERVFVTGIAGFIGFHVARRLVAMGKEVIGIDNFNNYYSPDLKEERAKLLRKEGVEVIKADICEKEALEKIIDAASPSRIIHLAAWAGVRASVANPEIYVKANIEGFLNLLEVAKKRPKIPLIYASSSSVYGKNEKVPFSVRDATDRPTNMYGMTKKANELMAFVFHNIYSMPLIGLRFFTVYGPFGRPDMAYYLFTKAIFEGRSIDLYNFGKMARDFTYVDDIVDGIMKSLEIDQGYHLFNLGNHEKVALLDFVKILEENIGKKAKINLLPMPQGEMQETYADISEEMVSLGFQPKVSLADGLKRFVSWYREYYKV